MAIVIHEVNNLNKVGKFSTGAFQIAATGQAFKILSDGLYPHKIKAVIRELSTNARDSHMAAGTMGRPFDVHLPTVVEPHFTIRDYGIGLCIQVFNENPLDNPDALPIYEGSYAEVKDYVDSHSDSDSLFVLDEAMSLYTTYFYSNKVHSNDFVGQLGLGSKSPFAYTDSFEVVVYYNGEQRSYQCSIGRNGIPEINYVKGMTKPTDQPTGVEVIIPVKPSDIHSFLEEAKTVYAYFDDIHPSVNLEDWTHPVRKYAFTGKDGTWGIRSESSAAHVIMGNIAYPIDRYEVSKYCKTGEETTLLNLPIEIKLPIGSCEIAPSREQLGYTKTTCKAIVDKLQQVISEVSQVISDKLNDAESIWDARCLAFEIFYDHNSKLRQLSRIANINQLKWNGIDLSYVSYIDISRISGVKCVKFSRTSTYDWRSGKNKARCTKSDTLRIIPNSNAIFYECDLARGAKNRIMQKVREDETATSAYMLTFDNAQARKDFLSTLGVNTNIKTGVSWAFVKASSLPKVVYNRASGTYNSTSEQVFKHNGNTNSRRFYEYWKESNIDIDDGGVYLEIKRYKANKGGVEIDPSVIGNLKKYCKEIGISLPAVIGVRPQVAKAFRKHAEWVTLWQWLENEIKQACVQNDLFSRISNTEEIQKVTESVRTICKSFESTETSVFSEFAKHIKDMINDYESMKDSLYYWNQILGVLGISNTEKPLHRLEAEEKKVRQHYRLLDLYLERGYYRDRLSKEEIKELCSYINLVDNN